jgi:hypothetical protein
VRLQTQSHTNPIYSGLGDCVRKTYAAEGFGGFYKGVASPLVGQMFFNAVQFAAYGQAKALVAGDAAADQITIPQYFQAGALTGAVVAGVESPIDLFKVSFNRKLLKQLVSAGSSILSAAFFFPLSDTTPNSGVQAPAKIYNVSWNCQLYCPQSWYPRRIPRHCSYHLP